MTDRWQKYTDVAINRESVEFFANNADELLVHGVSILKIRIVLLCYLLTG